MLLYIMALNFWTRDKIMAKGHSFFTLEIIDLEPESCVKINSPPTIQVVESLEGKPVCGIWMKFEATYPVERNGVLRVNNHTGKLKLYDNSGRNTAIWIMKGMKIEKVEGAKITFTFQSAEYKD